MTVTELEDAVRTWAIQASGMGEGKVIFGRQGAPAPALPYMTVTLLPVNRIGRDAYLPPETAGGTSFHRGDRSFTVSLQVFGPGARQTLYGLLNLMETWTVHEILSAAGIAINSHEAVLDLSAEVAGGMQERAALDVMMSAGELTGDATSTVDKVEGENEITGETWTAGPVA